VPPAGLCEYYFVELTCSRVLVDVAAPFIDIVEKGIRRRGLSAQDGPIGLLEFFGREDGGNI